MSRKEMERDIQFIRDNVTYLYELADILVKPMLATQQAQQVMLEKIEKRLRALETEVFGDDFMFN